MDPDDGAGAPDDGGAPPSDPDPAPPSDIRGSGGGPAASADGPGRQPRPSGERAPGDDGEEDGADESPTSTAFQRRHRRIDAERRRGAINLSGRARWADDNQGLVVQGDGASVFSGGEHMHTHVHTASFRLVSAPVPAEHLEHLVRTRVPSVPDALDEAVKFLREQRFVCVRGADGTGRTTTALVALHHVLAEITTAAPGGPAGVVERVTETTAPGQIGAGDLTAGHGYLFNLSGAEDLGDTAFDHLAHVAHEANVWIAVVADENATGDGQVSWRAVRSHRADPNDMLHRHLTVRLWGTTRHHLQKAAALEAHPDVRHELGRCPAPREVAALAANLADAVAADVPTEEILESLGGRLRNAIRAKLARPCSEPEVVAGADTPATRARRRAFLITSAIFSGLPLATVAELADLLAWRLHLVEEPDEPLRQSVFADDIEALLRYVGAEVTDGGRIPRSSDALTGVVRLRNTALPPVVLEVVWNYDAAVREPLLDWLNAIVMAGDLIDLGGPVAPGSPDRPGGRLGVAGRSDVGAGIHGDTTAAGAAATAAGEPGGTDQANTSTGPVESGASTDGDDRVRVRAAQAVGKLACHDPAYVHRRLLHQWASARGRPRQEAAAWALEIAADDPRLAPHVRKWVAQWSAGSLPRQRAAMLAYGARLASVFPLDARRHLDRMAEVRQHTRSWSLALAVRDMYRQGLRQEVQDMLSGWVERNRAEVRANRSPGSWHTIHTRPLVVQGARCVVALAAEGAETEGPEMLLAARADSGWHRDLRFLFDLALADAATAGDCWLVVRGWVEWAGRRPETVAPLAEWFLTPVLRDPRHRPRARFYRSAWSFDWEEQRNSTADLAFRRILGLPGRYPEE